MVRGFVLEIREMACARRGRSRGSGEDDDGDGEKEEEEEEERDMVRCLSPSGDDGSWWGFVLRFRLLIKL